MRPEREYGPVTPAEAEEVGRQVAEKLTRLTYGSVTITVHQGFVTETTVTHRERRKQ
jgi:hypothetical protein